ncbi:WD repeat-containing protein 43 [Macadamia integrifolia]|uniref:WD repeat-containing protein 43 n=1 Tax=Macadamia integrifolia TaxID=60698 RepID=UPI001C52AD50|nr:WD repeat-containing protein 43 [Macadamia integrifolia]
MSSTNIRDLLTSFSPSLDFFTLSSGDGRIKIWDTLKGQVQTEFADITSTNPGDLYTKPDRGHLSVDYTCMKWLPLEKKRKKEVGLSFVVLGTGSGDVLALDVSAGQLKWRVSDCHPGGVNAIASSPQTLCIYTAGADGMVCQIDSMTGKLLGKFRASTKAISSISVAPDGKTLATAAGQLKIFDSADNKRIQKFSGHPGAVRCMIFTEDGKHILSSAVGERYIAVWRVDGNKKKSATAVLAMEHPAVYLDSKCGDNNGTEDVSLYVLAISEVGLCYFWYGRNVEELHNVKPTKISLSIDSQISKNHKGASPTIFAAKLQSIVKPSSGQVFVAYGSLVKPSFEKISVQHGLDVKLSTSQNGVLLPLVQSHKSKKGLDVRTEVTALDRSNAEDALLPVPKVYEFRDKKRKEKHSNRDRDLLMTDDLVDKRREVKLMDSKDDQVMVEADTAAICMEDRLRSLGVLTSEEDLTRDSYPLNADSTMNSTAYSDAHFEAQISQKKIKASVLSMTSADAYKLLTFLVAMWKSRSASGKYVLPWISSILVNHSHYVISQEPANQMLNSLYKMAEFRSVAVQPLLQLSGRLQLITAQIDKAVETRSRTVSNDQQLGENDDEDEDEDVDEFVYGEEDEESQSGSDGDN